MATEARPTFLAITGQLEVEALDAALRFAAAVREASECGETDPAVAACSVLAARAFGGEEQAWAPLVCAVRDLLTAVPAEGRQADRSRRELRAFVAENADLLEP